MEDPSPLPIQSTSLPLLPHPSLLLTEDQTNFYLQLANARNNYQSLHTLRDNLISGSADYQLEPPPTESLPPLPPLLPTLSSYRPAGPASKSPLIPSKNRANSRPKIPTTSLPGSGQSLKEYIKSFNSSPSLYAVDNVNKNGQTANDRKGKNRDVEGECRAFLKYVDSAILVKIGLGGHRSVWGWAWISIKKFRDDGSREDGADVRSIKVGELRLYESESIPAIHSSSSNSRLTAISDNLLKLDLSLPELLYRLPRLPSTLQKPCYICQKLFLHPEGLPIFTGYIESEPKLALNSKRAIQSGDHSPPVDEDGSNNDIEMIENEEAAVNGLVKQNGNGSDKQVKEERKGEWVCWHHACETG